jgi:inorganic pyrophosphatase
MRRRRDELLAFSKIPIGTGAPEIINAVIEIPKGSHNKYEYDEELDQIRLDRVLHSPLYYPFDYGFVPQTCSEDGDHLDVLVVISDPVFSGCVVLARPIALLDVEDEGTQDFKIVAVAEKDPHLDGIRDVGDLSEHVRREVRHFFEQYKHLENKRVEFRGWLGREEAYRTINQAVERFEDKQHKC